MICYDCIRKTWRIKRRSACVYQWVTKPCPVCLSCCRRSCLRRRRSSMQLGQKMWVIFSSRIFQWKIWSILRLTLTHVASYVLKLNRQTDPSTCHRYLMTSGSLPWIPTSESISQGSDRCRCQRFIRKALTSVLDGSLAFFFVPFFDVLFRNEHWTHRNAHFCDAGWISKPDSNEMIWRCDLIPLVNPTTIGL